jgi:hypothetical protein
MHTHNWFAWTAIALSSLAMLTVFRGPVAKWVRKCKRRRGGVYLWRVDHHHNRARRVNGYVGETVSYHLRSRQHMGQSRFHPVTGKASPTAVHKVPAQPWSDLRPVMHKVIPLPWWLCWKWVLRPLETLVILVTWPRYNDAKNHWNPLRIDKGQAKLDRRQRDEGTAVQVVRVWTAHLFRYVVQAAGAALILAGLAGYVITR